MFQTKGQGLWSRLAVQALTSYLMVVVRSTVIGWYAVLGIRIKVAPIGIVSLQQLPL
jgi:hypothetical protein